MTIIIKPEWVTRAKGLQNKIFATGLRDTPNPTGLEAENRFVTGYVGEFCFQNILEQSGVRYEFQIKANGKSNEASEFTIWRQGKPFTVEVKTASQSWHKNFMFPKAQDWQKADLYVGMRLVDSGNAFCHGYLLANEVSKLPVDTFPPQTIKTRYCPLEEMHPIGLVLALADKKTLVPDVVQA